MFFGCENLSFKYGNVEVLKNVNFEIKKGEFIGLVGYNGSGKSTLLKVMSGILQPYSGNVYFKDETLDEKNRIKIGYIFQNPENQIMELLLKRTWHLV